MTTNAETTNSDAQTDTATGDVTIQDHSLYPTWRGEAPVNYREVRESVALVMQANEKIDNDEIEKIIGTVDDAVVQNESELCWEDDLEDGMRSVTLGEYADYWKGVECPYCQRTGGLTERNVEGEANGVCEKCDQNVKLANTIDE